MSSDRLTILAMKEAYEIIEHTLKVHHIINYGADYLIITEECCKTLYTIVNNLTKKLDVQKNELLLSELDNAS